MKPIEDSSIIIIEIINGSTDSINNFNILDSESKNPNVSIDISNFGFTFTDLKTYLKKHSISISETHIMSFNSAQLFELFQLKNIGATTNLMPIIEGYKNNCVMKYEHEIYTIVKDTSFTVKKICASTILKIFLKIKK